MKVIQTIGLVCSVSLLFVTISCSPDPPKQRLALKHPAVSEAERDWNETWIQVDDTWITRSVSHPVLLQIKGRNIGLSEASLSESDKLNGIEWKGVVNFDASTERLYALRDFSTIGLTFDKGWTAWMEPGSVFMFGQNVGQKEPVVQYSLEKRSGKWHILAKTAPIPMGPVREACQRPELAEIPK